VGQRAAVSPLGAFLRRHSRVGLDTSLFIYLLEENEQYVRQASEVFEWLENGANTGVTSTLTLTELLVRPYRDSNEELVNRYYTLLTLFPNLEWIAPDLRIADRAARIRAHHGLRTPDALQIATAVESGATAILTNDSSWQRVLGIEVGLMVQLR
jgi:predicted nucleic acid-binding protein